jgi:hypothetical protein
MGRKNISRGKNRNITDFSNLIDENKNKEESKNNLIKESEKKEG